MEEVTGILVDLFIIFAAARVAAEIFIRLRQPPIVAEVLVGIVIGPYALGLVGSPDNALIDSSAETVRRQARPSMSCTTSSPSSA